MAVPDIQDLHERYLRMLGGSRSAAEPIASESRTQSSQFRHAVPSEPYPAGDSDLYSGGVLGALGSSPQRTLWREQGFSPPTRAPVGPRGPWPAGRFGVGIGVPMAPAPDKIVEIPNPHLERFIPQSTRDIWSAATLLPWILRGSLVGEEGSNGAGEKKGTPLYEPPPQPPANGPRHQPPWIVGPAIVESAGRRQESFDVQPQASKQPDLDHRELRTVGPDSQEAGSISDLSEPSLIGYRKRRKALRGASPGGDSTRRRSFFAGAGNSGTGGKGPGRNGGDDDDYCASRKWEEEDECHKRWRDSEYAHPDHYDGCLTTAKIRWDLCNRNGGTPSPSEPRKWRMDPHEEVYINIGR